ncbi:MAG TPA: hypothetical protein VEV44_13170 [Pseudoneobacillus sp.]|nr:hypothetical protein [Pseudoneobacillus sp.]
METYLHLKTTGLEKHFLKMESIDFCEECKGTGFVTNTHSNDTFSFDNTSKCSVCNGMGSLN